MRHPLSLVRGLLAALCCTAAIPAQPLTPGNLLVTDGIYLYEYTVAGAQVRSVLVPHPTGGNALGDCVVDAAGWVHILSLSNQGQDYLTSYDPVDGTWQQDTIALSTLNTTDDDLALLGRTMFTRQQMVQMPGFGTSDISPTGVNFTEIAVGLNNKLYAVNAGSRNKVFGITTAGVVIDSLTLNQITNVTGLAVSATGDLFLGTLDGTIYHCDRTGQVVLGSIATGITGLTGLDLARDGTIAACGFNGVCAVTDVTLASVASFAIVPKPAYVTIVPAPAPAGPTDVGVISIDAPVNGRRLSATEPVTVTLGNFANARVLGFPVRLDITGPIPFTVTESFTGVLDGYRRKSFTFATPVDLSAPGLYTIQATTLLPGDADPSNDSSARTILQQPVISTFPWVETFESSDGGFVTTGTPCSWEYGVPTSSWVPYAASGTKAWATDLDGNFFTNEMSALVSPPIDCTALTADPTLRFAYLFKTDVSTRMWVEMSVDGAPFYKVGSNGGAGSTNWYNLGSGVNAWTGSSGTARVWQIGSQVLEGAAGHGIVLRWMLSTSSVPADGYGIDDVSVIPTPFGTGQPSRASWSLLDINGSSETLRYPPASGYPGPYFSTVSVANDTFDLRFEGPVFTPVVLLGGSLSVGAFPVPPLGQIDLAPVSVYAGGIYPGGLNALFFTNAAGAMTFSVTIPQSLAGGRFAFQGVLLPSFTTPLITNAVEVTFVP